MSTRLTDYFLGRLNGRSVSTTTEVSGGASPNAGGALPKSVAAGAEAGATTGCATGALTG